MIRVRQATQSDAPEVSRLAGKLDHRGHELHPTIAGEPPSPSRSKEWLAEQLGYPHVRILVAEDSSQILVGLVRAHVGPPPPSLIMKQAPVGWLHELVAASADNYEAILRALLESIHEWFESQDVDQIRATVWDFQERDIPVLRELGYSAVSQTVIRDR